MHIPGAIFGAMEILASRSVSRDQYQTTGKVPDWCVVLEPEEHDDHTGSALNTSASASSLRKDTGELGTLSETSPVETSTKTITKSDSTAGQ